MTLTVNDPINIPIADDVVRGSAGRLPSRPRLGRRARAARRSA